MWIHMMNNTIPCSRVKVGMIVTRTKGSRLYTSSDEDPPPITARIINISYIPRSWCGKERSPGFEFDELKECYFFPIHYGICKECPLLDLSELRREARNIMDDN